MAHHIKGGPRVILGGQGNPPLETKCKADLTALEHAFRAGWAARDIACPSINAVLLTPSAAWNEFLAGEMKAFET